MQRLALFDLDKAFQTWAREFTDEHDLGREAADWLLALDRAGYPHREVFFAKVRDHFALPNRPMNCGAATAGACHTSSAAVPQ
ncbi:hypothetical protein [Streptosporangium sp. NPDC001681]|uniref:hypothetical protein n=1 Tax=Streptosporangium sp. NPDC001681 TaxID=3154395 RepID=UPI003318C44B